MKILLDTQVFIWLINEDENLGQEARTIVYSLGSDIKLSYFSVFEITIKASIGKLDYDPSLLDDLPKMGVELLMPRLMSLNGYSIFNPDNKDPFDNALIVTALNENCVFMTSDQKILETTAKGLQLLNAMK